MVFLSQLTELTQLTELIELTDRNITDLIFWFYMVLYVIKGHSVSFGSLENFDFCFEIY